MTIANPLTMTLGGSGGTAKVLDRINNDNYGSEYYLRETTQDFRLKIRHSRESAKADGVVLERHNVEFTQTIFGTAGAADEVVQVYLVLRCAKTSSLTLIHNVGTALSYYMDATHFDDIASWKN